MYIEKTKNQKDNNYIKDQLESIENINPDNNKAKTKYAEPPKIGEIIPIPYLEVIKSIGIVKPIVQPA